MYAWLVPSVLLIIYCDSGWYIPRVIYFACFVMFSHTTQHNQG
jgi:hypothetical protein